MKKLLIIALVCLCFTAKAQPGDPGGDPDSTPVIWVSVPMLPMISIPYKWMRFLYDQQTSQAMMVNKRRRKE